MRSIHRGYNFRVAQTTGTITPQPKLLHSQTSHICITFESIVYRITGDGHRGVYTLRLRLIFTSLIFYGALFAGVSIGVMWSSHSVVLVQNYLVLVNFAVSSVISKRGILFFCTVLYMKYYRGFIVRSVSQESLVTWSKIAKH